MDFSRNPLLLAYLGCWVIFMDQILFSMWPFQIKAAFSPDPHVPQRLSPALFPQKKYFIGCSDSWEFTRPCSTMLLSYIVSLVTFQSSLSTWAIHSLFVFSFLPGLVVSMWLPKTQFCVPWPPQFKCLFVLLHFRHTLPWSPPRTGQHLGLLYTWNLKLWGTTLPPIIL